MGADKLNKTQGDRTGNAADFLSYLITLVQLTLVAILILMGVGWIAITTDLWLDPKDSVTESLKFLSYLIGLAGIIYLLGYLNKR